MIISKWFIKIVFLSVAQWNVRFWPKDFCCLNYDWCPSCQITCVLFGLQWLFWVEHIYKGNSYCVCKYKNLIILRGFVNVTSMPLEKDYVKFCWLYLEDQRNGSNTFCVKLVIDFLRVKYLWAAWMRLQKILVKFGSGAMICGLFIFFVVINNSTNSSSKVEDIFDKSM